MSCAKGDSGHGAPNAHRPTVAMTWLLTCQQQTPGGGSRQRTWRRSGRWRASRDPLPRRRRWIPQQAAFPDYSLWSRIRLQPQQVPLVTAAAWTAENPFGAASAGVAVVRDPLGRRRRGRGEPPSGQLPRGSGDARDVDEGDVGVGADQDADQGSVGWSGRRRCRSGPASGQWRQTTRPSPSGLSLDLESDYP